MNVKKAPVFVGDNFKTFQVYSSSNVNNLKRGVNENFKTFQVYSSFILVQL